MCFFFKPKTAYDVRIRGWSSDVCSSDLRFVAFDNYVGLLHNPLFWKTLGNTLYFVIVGVPLSIAVSLGAAVLLHSKLGRFKGFFRTAFFAPVVTTVVAVAVIWRDRKSARLNSSH